MVDILRRGDASGAIRIEPPGDERKGLEARWTLDGQLWMRVQVKTRAAGHDSWTAPGLIKVAKDAIVEAADSNELLFLASTSTAGVVGDLQAAHEKWSADADIDACLAESKDLSKAFVKLADAFSDPGADVAQRKASVRRVLSAFKLESGSESDLREALDDVLRPIAAQTGAQVPGDLRRRLTDQAREDGEWSTEALERLVLDGSQRSVDDLRRLWAASFAESSSEHVAVPLADLQAPLDDTRPAEIRFQAVASGLARLGITGVRPATLEPDVATFRVSGIGCAAWLEFPTGASPGHGVAVLIRTDGAGRQFRSSFDKSEVIDEALQACIEMAWAAS